MKKLLNSIFVVILFMALTTIRAQAGGCTQFQPAIVNPPFAYMNVNPGYTGNDSRTDPFNNTMEVSVWDNNDGFVNNPILAWNYNNGVCTGRLQLPNDERFPDVHAEYSNNVWYAIVAYGVPTSHSTYYCYYDVYIFDIPSCTWSPYGNPTRNNIPDNTGTGANAEFSNVIRIDGNTKSSCDWAIFWDNNDVNSTYRGINAIAGNGTYICNWYNESELLVPSTFMDTYLYPDLTFITPCDLDEKGTIYFTYADITNPNILNVGSIDHENLCHAQTISLQPHRFTFPAQPNHIFTGRPRIASNDACHCAPVDEEDEEQQSCGCAPGWTVVSEYQGFSTPPITPITFDIIGYTAAGYTAFCNGAIYGPHIYTNHSLTPSPCSINDFENTDPAVTYDYWDEGIIIGWDSWYPKDNVTPFNPTQSVAVTCNRYGLLRSCNIYNIVSTNSQGANDVARYLSLSGTNLGSENIQYTFSCPYQGFPYDAYKDVPFTYCGNLRLSEKNVSNPDDITISPNPFTNQITVSYPDNYAQIKVFDITGNLLFEVTGNENEINRSLNQLSINLPKGVYMLRLETADGINTETKKLIKM